MISPGDRFGKLTAIRKEPWISKGTRWWCRCDCGIEKHVWGTHLTRGNTKSCGCSNFGSRKHGEWNGRKYSSEYMALAQIIQRCSNPDDPAYHHYGGRGIKVCEEWNSMFKFSAFLDHVGRRPSPAHSIDRIDVDGHYKPGNVRWATRKTQSRNRRDTVFVEYNGERISAADLADRNGINIDSFKSRLRLGWPIEDAIRIPVKHRKQLQLN